MYIYVLLFVIVLFTEHTKMLFLVLLLDELPQIKFKLIYDRRSVGQSVLVSGSHLETMIRFLFFVWRLWVSWCGAPPLTREWVCNLLVQLLLGLAEQSLLGQSSAELATIFYCLIWDSPNLEGQVPVFISPRNGAAQLYPWSVGSLLSPITTRKATVEVF
jgi:hypothetical protein